jgi:hypothetical protein
LRTIGLSWRNIFPPDRFEKKTVFLCHQPVNTFYGVADRIAGRLNVTRGSDEHKDSFKFSQVLNLRPARDVPLEHFL